MMAINGTRELLLKPLFVLIASLGTGLDLGSWVGTGDAKGSYTPSTVTQ